MFYPSLRKPAPEALRNWQERRRMTRDLVSELQSVGECYQCADQASGGRVFGSQHIVYSDDRLFAALSNDPRAPGHTVVVWRAHVHDFSKLDELSTSHLFNVCRRVAKALEDGLGGVERVYLVSMCDGAINHLHVQLIPRYKGQDIGSTRLVADRGPLTEPIEIASAVEKALETASSVE